MASTSLPPPRGPFLNGIPCASFAVLSKFFHAAFMSDASLLASAESISPSSKLGILPGAPKSVVAFPSIRSVTLNSEVFAGSWSPLVFAPIEFI